MNYIRDILNILFAVLIFVGITRMFMAVANYIGEKLGIGQFVIGLRGKIRKNK